MTHAESVYLDANATTIAHPEVIESMVSCMNEHGNPSSLHQAGQSARRRVELARGEVAALVGVRPSEIVFTSGGPNQTTLRLREHLMPSIGASVGGRSGACCRSRVCATFGST